MSIGGYLSPESSTCCLHMAGMDLLGRVEQAPNLPPVERARLANAAARLFEAFQTDCLTLQKLKTGGRQHVVVQHQQVNVGQGGQVNVAGKHGRVASWGCSVRASRSTDARRA